jgi:hypothetical protein
VLSEQGLRSALELHLAVCEMCRWELKEIEQIGHAYSSFSVNEHSPQMFADYGQKVRLKMKEETHRFSGLKFSRNKKFWLAGAVSVCAACAATWIMIATLSFTPQITATPTMAQALIELEKESPKKEIRRAPSQIHYEYPTPTGLQRVSLQAPFDPRSMDQIQQHEGRSGYLVFPEPLLGVRLKTTREVDRVADEGPGGLIVDCVIPGSPAWRMGIRKNDFIVTLNSEGIKDGGALEALKFQSDVRELGAGKTVTLHIVRPVNSQYLYLKPVAGILGEYEYAP